MAKFAGEDRILCPACNGDIDSEVGEHFALDGPGDWDCPLCGKPLRFKIEVDYVEPGD